MFFEAKKKKFKKFNREFSSSWQLEKSKMLDSQKVPGSLPNVQKFRFKKKQYIPRDVVLLKPSNVQTLLAL